ncbi:hypothetical protein M8C13_01765 [Crossiella sp. SN42]|uniref:hypothetical protein n=1 Tax=Crossiella sp. SN42 TaxID=2944808 RepID=UPI00207D3FC7|nr:hypothetical protein [Crossiella sp. SN42]MCO1574484.1 hypothetical protein [Crossiella sp. SN42]
MSTDEDEQPQVANTVSGPVHGAAVQAGVVHGGVHVNAAPALAAVDELATAFGSRSALRQLMTDLEAVHRDYLLMFDKALELTPEAWQHGMPHFPDQVRAAANLLRRLRLEFEPVRVRVHAVAHAFSDAKLTEPERAFAVAVLKYFPTGEIQRSAVHQLKTSGTAVLDRFYASLDGELGQELSSLIEETVAFHRQRWLVVCQAYAALQTA